MTLRDKRKAAGLTQARAAELVGVCRRTWANWEHGKTRMPKAARQVFEDFLSATARKERK